ncbi:MAG: hypothetical protein MMC23_009135 [Stictis urceolatum]|nr:hypothetical protein [Stictis urceolata]
MVGLKLWMWPGSCSLAPHILLRESGLDFDTAVIDGKQGLPEELIRINSKKKVPTLQLDGYVVTENPAIMTAISQLCPSKDLFGKTDMDKVRSYEWMNWLSGTLHGLAFGALFKPQFFSGDESTHAAVRAKGREKVEECFEAIEQKLSSVHAVGDSFTAVDAYLFVFYRWGNGAGIDMETRFPRYTDLVLEVAKRDAVQNAIVYEKIDLLRD